MTALLGGTEYLNILLVVMAIFITEQMIKISSELRLVLVTHFTWPPSCQETFPALLVG